MEGGCPEKAGICGFRTSPGSHPTQEQAAVDSGLVATLRHAIFREPAPLPAAHDPDRITFTQLRVAASYDPVAFRAFWRLMFMLGR